MSRRRKKDAFRQPGLFDDFELRPEPTAHQEGSVTEAPVEEPEEPPPRQGPTIAALQARFFGGLVDLAIHVALLAGVVVVVRLMGVAPGTEEIVPLLLVALVFSLFYAVIPLAFWGQTPGMRAAGLVVRAGDGGPMTFGQAARRWFGSLVSVAAVGLPTLLVAFGGRSLADRLSDTDTFEG